MLLFHFFKHKYVEKDTRVEYDLKSGSLARRDLQLLRSFSTALDCISWASYQVTGGEEEAVGLGHVLPREQVSHSGDLGLHIP